MATSSTDEKVKTSSDISSTTSPLLSTETPVIISVNGTEESTNQPSSASVAIPETQSSEHVSPRTKTNQSRFGRVRTTWKKSSGISDFLKGLLKICGGTVLVIVSIAVYLALSIGMSVAMIVIGSIYLGECPVEQYIPIYLIVGGTFGLLYNCFCPNSEEDTGQSNCQLCRCIFSWFLFAWFITGCVWTYTVYEPEYEDKLSLLYCNKTLYLFTFWQITLTFIICGFAICCGILCILIVAVTN